MKISREKAFEIAKVLYSKGGEDILLLHVEDMTIIADYFVICTGRSGVQVKALSDHVEDKLAEDEITVIRKEGYNAGRWVVLDYSDVLVHIMLDEEREFYNIERLWVSGTNTVDFLEEE